MTKHNLVIWVPWDLLTQFKNQLSSCGPVCNVNLQIEWINFKTYLKIKSVNSKNNILFNWMIGMKYHNLCFFGEAFTIRIHINLQCIVYNWFPRSSNMFLLLCWHQMPLWWQTELISFMFVYKLSADGNFSFSGVYSFIQSTWNTW